MSKLRIWVDKIRNAVSEWVAVQPPASGIHIPEKPVRDCVHCGTIGAYRDPEVVKHRPVYAPQRDWLDMNIKYAEVVDTNVYDTPTHEQMMDPRKFMASIRYVVELFVDRDILCDDSARTMQSVEIDLHHRLRYSIHAETIAKLIEIRRIATEIQPSGHQSMEVCRRISTLINKLQGTI